MQARKYSKKRNAILGLIRSSKAHPQAQWVYERLKPEFPDLSLGTVYRNIKVLLEENALASVGVVQGEERFDGDSRPHAHAICRRCGMIVDLGEASTQINAYIPAIPPGFAIDIRRTVFYGLCGECSKETAALGR